MRRYEFDDFLLKRSKVETFEEYQVRNVSRDNEGYWVIDQKFRAKYLIGAGGSHCPVARAVFPQFKKVMCGTQEKEFEGKQEEIAAFRAGEDGEPEIILHDDLKGYSWNVPKSNWLNIGTGTTHANEVKAAWNKSRAFFEGIESQGTIPLSSRPPLDKMKGHGYSSFDPKHLDSCYADHVFLVGDALGLAQPVTGEGIVPAALSGKLCASAIIEGAPETYRERLQKHSTICGYQDLYSVRIGLANFFKGTGVKSRFIAKIAVTIFVTLFSGKPLPGIRLLAKFAKS
jgi:flavin-dependent dehydrogenase